MFALGPDPLKQLHYVLCLDQKFNLEISNGDLEILGPPLKTCSQLAH